MNRKKHPNKEIDSAIKHALTLKWKLIKPGKSAHIWGKLLCPTGDRSAGCIIFVYSTPQVPENHANQIIRAINKCDHELNENEK
ncbi:MAG: hypothetical protein ACE5D0_08420 [Fidelibacterota bacterium]